MRWALAFLFATLGFAQQRVSVCQLRENPWNFHNKYILVEGFVQSGFEVYMLQDPNCDKHLGIWLERGGNGEVFRWRGDKLVKQIDVHEVEGVKTYFAVNQESLKYDKAARKSNYLHARFKGRYFAGRKGRLAGFGHLGCCSLFVMEEVVGVESTDRQDLDYDIYTFSKSKSHGHCLWKQDLATIYPGAEAIHIQRTTSNGADSWVYDHPERVALDALAKLVPGAEPKPQDLFIEHAGYGRHEYTWGHDSSGHLIRLIISKQSWLVHFAENPERIPWLAVSVTKEDCGKP